MSLPLTHFLATLHRSPFEYSQYPFVRVWVLFYGEVKIWVHSILRWMCICPAHFAIIPRWLSRKSSMGLSFLLFDLYSFDYPLPIPLESLFLSIVVGIWGLRRRIKWTASKFGLSIAHLIPSDFLTWLKGSFPPSDSENNRITFQNSWTKSACLLVY